MPPDPGPLTARDREPRAATGDACLAHPRATIWICATGPRTATPRTGIAIGVRAAAGPRTSAQTSSASGGAAPPIRAVILRL